MERKEELIRLVEKIKNEGVKKLCLPLIDELIYLESELDEIKKHPFIKIHPSDPSKQKILPAQKIYVSLMTQYNGTIRTLSKMLVDNGAKDVSPLREYFNKVHGGDR